MSLKKISKTEAIDRADEGDEVYILQRITDKTTLAELRHALAFAVFTVEDSDIREKLQQAEEQILVAEPEEVAVQTEAPADKSRVPKSIVNHDKIVELYQKGWSTKAIAKVVEASDQTVRNHLKAEGILLRGRV